jgi:Winged helix DNA-binding domain
MPRKALPAAVVLRAEKVAAWRLARQHLAGNPARDAVSVARDLVGVQAQVLSSAALSVALRSKVTVDATTRGLKSRKLVRMWGQRGTLHVFAADDVATIVAARSRHEPWRRPAWLRYFRVTEPQMERAIAAVGEILDDGVPRTRKELADAIVAKHGPDFAHVIRGSWGSFLTQAGNKGYVTHAWTADSSVRFVRPDRWLGTWRAEDMDEALRSVTLRYLAAYGPASAAELNRWWGVTGGGLKPVLAELGDELTEVDVEGQRGLVRTEDLGAIEATRLPRKERIILLGAFDPLIVGAGLRSHLIPAAHLSRVSRTAGWISPVVLIDGVAAGVWDMRLARDELTITIDPFGRLNATRRDGIEAAAEAVGRAHGAAVAVRYGKVFATPPKTPDGEEATGPNGD